MNTTTTDIMYMPDANQVHPQLWVGGDMHQNVFIAAGQFRGAKHLGIDVIIDTRIEMNESDLCHDAVGDEITYHHIPTDDHGGQLKLSWWKDVLAAAKPHVEAGETILVHCHMGCNRGPSAAFAIMTQLLNVPMIEAYDTIKRERFQAHVIYADQAAIRLGTDEAEVTAFLDHFEANQDWDALVATIGLIRKSEYAGEYRIPLVEING